MNRECIAGIAFVVGAIGGTTIARAGEDAELKFEPAPAIAGEAAGKTSAPGEGEGDAKPVWHETEWKVQILGMAWAPGLSGNVRSPGGSGKATIPMLGLDDPELTPAGQLVIRAGKLFFTFGGFGYGSDQTSRATDSFSIGSLDVSPGDSLNVKFDYSSVEGTVAWRLWDEEIPSREGDTGVALFFDLGAGLRGYDIDFSASSGESSTGAHEMWIEPIATAKLTMEILDKFTVDVGVTVGAQPFGDHTSYSAGVQTGFQWRFTENAGLEIGYRLLHTNLETGNGSDEFSFDGMIAGLFGGITLRF